MAMPQSPRKTLSLRRKGSTSSKNSTSDKGSTSGDSDSAGDAFFSEQPIFSTRAHIFQIDPSTKKNWLPSSKQAVAVSFFFDSIRKTYRVISVDGSKAIINSTIIPTMVFTKTSQKFGQWADTRANTVYGLGFSSEMELNKFVEKFNEAKEKSKNGSGSDKKGGGGDSSSDGSGSRISIVHEVPANHIRENSGDSGSGSGTSLPTITNDAQLKYENDRLKIALAQSSNNAKKWELELQTLKNNNARLTTALQESTANVEEWKKQLSLYKEENFKLHKRIQELEPGKDTSADINGELNGSNLEGQLHALTLAHKENEQEAEDLTKRLSHVSDLEEENNRLRGQSEQSEETIQNLRNRIEQLEGQLATEQDGRHNNTQNLHQVHSQMGALLQQFTTLHQELGQSL